MSFLWYLFLTISVHQCVCLSVSSTTQHFEGSSYSHPLLEDGEARFAKIPNLFQALALPKTNPTLPDPVANPNPTHKAKPTYALLVSYKGTSFPGGYEMNPTLDVPTVQQCITDRIKQVLDTMNIDSTNLRVSTAGRTDANVSARMALFSFNLRNNQQQPCPFSNDDFKNLVNALSVDGDLWIQSVHQVDETFHATFSTTAREYVYVLPISLWNSYLIPGGLTDETTSLDERVARLASVTNELLEQVEGVEMDYFALSHGKPKTNSNDCTMYEVGCWSYDKEGCCTYEPPSKRSDVLLEFGKTWKECLLQQDDLDDEDDDPVTSCLVFRVRGDRFLRRMMRKMVNSVLMEASLIMELDEDLDNDMEWKNQWKEMIERKDRSHNQPAPAEGLCLWRVFV